MGEISRFFANVFTLGAAKRVDDAMSSYRSLVYEYNNYGNEVKKLQGDILSLQNELIQCAKFTKSNKNIVLRILKNESIYRKLTVEELNTLKSYSANLPAAPSWKVAKGINSLSSYEDDVCSDIALCAATTLLPILGIFAAHGIASDDIERINTEKKKVLTEISKLIKNIETLTFHKNQLKKKLAAQQSIKKLILWYKREHPGIFGFIKNLLFRR